MITDDQTRQRFRKLLQSFLDGEATETERTFVFQQIKQCSNCENDYECEKAIHDFIRRKICYEIPPHDLKTKIASFAYTA